jgi:spermidine synthase
MIRHTSGGFYRDDDPGEPSSRVARISIADDERTVLAEMAAGKNVLEIGTGLGVSTRALATTATRVVTCDIDEWVHHTIWPDLPANVACVSSTDDLELGFDLVFIDGDHREEALQRDVATAERLLAPGGTIVVHDAHHLMPHLGRGWELSNTCYGLAVRHDRP